jgi:hypothetical protein
MSLMLMTSSRPPAIAPASSAKTMRNPERERSTARKATIAIRQKSAPPRVGVPSLARCEAGLYEATC